MSIPLVLFCIILLTLWYTLNDWLCPFVYRQDACNWQPPFGMDAGWPDNYLWVLLHIIIKADRHTLLNRQLLSPKLIKGNLYVTDPSVGGKQIEAKRKKKQQITTTTIECPWASSCRFLLNWAGHIFIPANSPGFPGSLQVFHQISRSPG